MVQLFINAVALGSAYALLALGFVLILSATNAVNFAHGDMVMVGGYVAVGLASVLGWHGIFLLPLVIGAMAVFGLLFSALAYFPLKNRPPVSLFISTIAVGIILQNGVNVLAGAEPRKGPALFTDGALDVLGSSIGTQALGIIGVTALLILLQHFVLNHTGLGRRLRATAQDRQMAQAVGIRVNAMIALTFAIGSALAGAAGLLLSNTFFLSPMSGSDYILKAYIAVTIGGWGNLYGAVCGAMLIALFEVIYPSLPVLLPQLGGAFAWLFSQTTSSIVLYCVLLGIMLFRPQGLFGEAIQQRA